MAQRTNHFSSGKIEAQKLKGRLTSGKRKHFNHTGFHPIDPEGRIMERDFHETGETVRVRQQLQEQDQTIPDQRGQPAQTPTMRRIAQRFEGVDLLIIHQGSQVIERQVLKLTPVRLQLIRLFGPAIQNCYLVEI